MPPKRQVYLLDPQKLPPETIAVTFAKTSRSPQSFQEIARELTDEKSAEFHEKWVVGYGHASVAEHAILHIAVENISRLAVETLESCRLASYTEKSTRYQKWSPEDFTLPEELNGHTLQNLYLETVESLFQAYRESLEPVKAVIEQEFPCKPDESNAAWERRIRSKYVDVCRFYLPAASLANVGVTINARALEHSISKMLSHPLEEVRSLGADLKSAGQQTVPTLIKYADPIPYLQDLNLNIPAFVHRQPVEPSSTEDWCAMVDYDQDSENRILAGALYRFSQHSYAQCLAAVQQLPPAGREELAGLILSGLGKYTIPIRELEYARFLFDVKIDQGAFFELKRHRMMTQTAQPLSTALGFAVPRRLMDAGLEQHYRTAMQAARDAYDKIAAWNPDVASYVVPNGYNRRVLLDFNLRSGEHLLGLRSAANAHFSLRRLTQRMAEQIRSVLPLFGQSLRVNPTETWQQIEAEYFAEV